jgi:hypothetical protein
MANTDGSADVEERLTEAEDALSDLITAFKEVDSRIEQIVTWIKAGQTGPFIP